MDIQVNEQLLEIYNRVKQLIKYDMRITEGVRNLERQKLLVKRGASRTLKSKHLTGNAIDIVLYVDGKVTWDIKYYDEVSIEFKKVAKELDVNLIYGGDWSFRDGVHYEIGENKHEEE